MPFWRPSRLAACGDSEATQRKAFIEFLQTRIVDKPGLHVPKPSDEQTKAFGPYAKDYGIILGFNEGMDKNVSGSRMEQVFKRGMVRSLDELTTRRADIGAAMEGMRALRAALEAELAKADAAHAALKQPEDMKPVYDKAYERTVTAPAATFKEAFPAGDAAFQAAQNFASFLDQHHDSIKINGNSIQTSDPKLNERDQPPDQRLQSEQPGRHGGAAQATGGHSRVIGPLANGGVFYDRRRSLRDAEAIVARAGVDLDDDPIDGDARGLAAGPDRFHRDEARRFHLRQGAREVWLRPAADTRGVPIAASDTPWPRESVLIESERKLWILVLTRFLHANRVSTSLEKRSSAAASLPWCSRLCGSGTKRGNAAHVLLAFGVPSIVSRLHADPDSGAVAKQVAE